MNTVYGKLLLWCFVTLVASMVALTAVSLFVRRQFGDHGGGPDRLNILFVEQAVDAYRTGGASALQAELGRIDRFFHDHHYLVDAMGKDLATGEDRSQLLQKATRELRPIPFLIPPHSSVTPTRDGRYRLLVIYRDRFDFRPVIPYQVLLLVAVAVLCGTLAANLASPLRKLARAVDRFGAGDLTVRMNSTRKDEIGEVSRAFDRMAERIGTLLTAERRLLQDISHELRSPLARLSFAAELARTAPDREAAIARLKKEVARLTDLVGGLIQVTRVEGDPTAHQSQVLQLKEVVGEVVSDCRVESAQRDCKIAYDPGGDAISLYGDREILRRAVENVLRNAIRYAPAATAVEVALARSAETARLSIRDYGPGVPDDVLSKIFQPFFRLDDSRDTSTGGVGLGLAIAHRAISVHHGKLWAENAAPGLRVWIELPLVKQG